MALRETEQQVQEKAASHVDDELANKLTRKDQHMEWTKEFSEIARSQGWGVFAINGDEYDLAIQKLDESDIFATDEEAIKFVINKYLTGDPVAVAAINIVFEEVVNALP